MWGRRGWGSEGSRLVQYKVLCSIKSGTVKCNYIAENDLNELAIITAVNDLDSCTYVH